MICGINNTEDVLLKKCCLSLLENCSITWGMCLIAAKCNIMIKQTVYFLWFALLWSMVPLTGIHTDSVNIEKVQCRAASFLKRRYGRNSSVSEMLDELGLPPLSQKRHDDSFISTNYQRFDRSVLRRRPYEAYKGTRSTHNKKFRQIGHLTSQYGQLFSYKHKTISAWNGLNFAKALPLALFKYYKLLN